MRVFIVLILFVVALAAACDSEIPTVPTIVVPITAVDDSTALANAVAEALTGTAMDAVGLTETQFAREGITLTPTLTATPTITPLAPTATEPLPPSPTYTPSVTPTATFAPFPTNVIPDSSQTNAQGSGRLRVLNAWAQYAADANTQVDVYINDQRVMHALEMGQATAYQRVAPGAVRVSLYPADTLPTEQPSRPPLVSQTVQMTPGGSISMVVADFGQGVSLLPVVEDPTPLASGMSRLTVLQANPDLPEINILLPDAKRALASFLQNAELVGPMDLPRNQYRLELYDSATPELLVADVSGVNLIGQVNHLLVLTPPSPDSLSVTDVLLFTGSTQRVESDRNVRFVNAATELGPLSFVWDDLVQLTNLNVGSLSAPVPISSLGTDLALTDARNRFAGSFTLGPWNTPEEDGDKIILILNDPSSSGALTMEYSQNAPPSAIRANLRLIHSLPDTVPLSLQTRVYRTDTRVDEDGDEETFRVDTPWEVVTGNVSYSLASDYEGRAPDLYDIRVVLTGTETEIARLDQVQLVAGGIYDFVVAPGEEPGSANLLMIQPEVQVGPASEQNPAAIREIVDATLTAMATPDANTATPVRTPTPTISPVPTNTPNPTNTPSVSPPELLVDPVPPNAASGSFTVLGVNFAAGERYSISLDGGRELQTGRVGEDGSVLTVVALPADITPGPHIVQICVDCTNGGLQQSDFAIVVVADPSATPSPTPVA
jgi:hypothetical protein